MKAFGYRIWLSFYEAIQYSKILLVDCIKPSELYPFQVPSTRSPNTTSRCSRADSGGPLYKNHLTMRASNYHSFLQLIASYVILTSNLMSHD